MFNEGAGQTKVKCAARMCLRAAEDDSIFCRHCLQALPVGIPELVETLTAELATVKQERDMQNKALMLAAQEITQIQDDLKCMTKHRGDALKLLADVTKQRDLLRKAFIHILYDMKNCTLECSNIVHGSEECIALHLEKAGGER